MLQAFANRMSLCECSACGVSAPAYVWGFALLVRDGWELASETNAPQVPACERAWLCNECATYARRSPPEVSQLFAAKHPAALQRESQPPRVLVVDDQVLMLRCLVRMLAGYETVIADGPAKALALLRSGMQFDAVVCDVMMPDMTGPELYVRCCHLFPDLAERFVFTSADPIIARCMIDHSAAQIGARHTPPLLQKPTSRDLLLASLKGVVAIAAQRSGTYMRYPSSEGSRNRSSASDQEDTLPQRKSSSGSRGSRF